MKYTLADVLGTSTIEFEHQGIEFKFVPFSGEQISQWNEAISLEANKGEKQLAFAERTKEAQYKVLLEHFKKCSSKSVDGKFIKQLPETFIAELVVFFLNGTKPAWAKVSEKN